MVTVCNESEGPPFNPLYFDRPHQNRPGSRGDSGSGDALIVPKCTGLCNERVDRCRPAVGSENVGCNNRRRQLSSQMFTDVHPPNRRTALRHPAVDATSPVNQQTGCFRRQCWLTRETGGLAAAAFSVVLSPSGRVVTISTPVVVGSFAPLPACPRKFYV